jgi:hypothetical protein
MSEDILTNVLRLSYECLMIVLRLSYDCLTIFVRLSINEQTCSHVGFYSREGVYLYSFFIHNEWHMSHRVKQIRVYTQVSEYIQNYTYDWLFVWNY